MIDLTKALMIEDRHPTQIIEVFGVMETKPGVFTATAGRTALSQIIFDKDGRITGSNWHGYKVVNAPPLPEQIKAWEREKRKELLDHDEKEAMEASPLWGAW